MKTCIIVILSLFSFAFADVNERVLTDDFVDETNRKQSTWVAGRNFPENTSLTYLHTIAAGVIGIDTDCASVLPVIRHEARAMPTSFDARSRWTSCPSIGQVRNQEACGSCWAFGAVETMSDRLCIHSNSTIKFKFSIEDLMTCCTACGNGCKGGRVSEAFKYWISTGIVSGGDAGSNEGCQPYANDAAKNGQTPACSRTCRSGFGGSYDGDKRYGMSTHQVTGTVSQIASDIQFSGPSVATYMVYEDFYNYKSGVYQHVTGNEVGWHAIKLLGWGEENGVPYWLAANSWGSGWGSLGGFFKILRGQNHCHIEEYVFSGLPKVD